MAKKKKKSTASGAAPKVPQQGQQDSTSGPKADPELVDAGYDVAGAQVPEADGSARGPPSTDRHNTRSTAQGPGSLDGSVNHHNNTSAVSAGHSGLQQSHDGSPPLPHRPMPSDRPPDDVDDSVSGPVEESTKPSIPEGLSHIHQYYLQRQQQQQQQGADKGGTNGPHEHGTSTTSGWGITSLFSRGGSSAGGRGSDAPPRRDKTTEELANTKRELERVQKEARFYRQEMEQSNYELQRATGDNRVYSRNIHELQAANARLKDHLLGSQHELANVQRKLDDAKVLADTRGRELQATRRQNSSVYKSGLNFFSKLIDYL